MSTSSPPVDADLARRFLSPQHRIAVVGASDDPQNFGRTVYRELRDHGHDVAAVNPGATTVLGDPCHPDLRAVPGVVDVALVMVGPDRAEEAVSDAIAAGVERIWLFKGVGGPGSVSSGAVQLCTDAGVEVVAGACPLMFLEPTALVHRVHRRLRSLRGGVVNA